MSWKCSELLGAWILSWRAGGCHFSRRITHLNFLKPPFLFLGWPLLDMAAARHGQGAHNSLPLGMGTYSRCFPEGAQNSPH